MKAVIKVFLLNMFQSQFIIILFMKETDFLFNNKSVLSCDTWWQLFSRSGYVSVSYGKTSISQQRTKCCIYTAKWARS